MLTDIRAAKLADEISAAGGSGILGCKYH